MTTEMESKIRSVDLDYLTEVVRKDLLNPDLTITNWDVQRLSDKGIINPDGLWLVSGQAMQQHGLQPWSVVVKIFKYPDGKRPASGDWEGKRELLVAQTGFTKDLPGPLKAPRFYGVLETSDSAWLWMEHVKTDRPRWGLEEYAFAAREIGRWNAAYLTGTPLPDQPWLARRHYLGWLGWADNQAAYNYHLNQKYITRDARRRQERLWTEKEKFIGWLERLPLVFSHFDLQRRNLFIRRTLSGQDELAAVDWAACGIGPLGAELHSLVGGTAIMFEWPISTLPQLDEITFNSYIEGLRQVGWVGDPRLVRLGYSAWMAVWYGCVIPSALAFWTSEDSRSFAIQQFGLAGEELHQACMPVLDFMLDRADEARELAAQCF